MHQDKTQGVAASCLGTWENRYNHITLHTLHLPSLLSFPSFCSTLSVLSWCLLGHQAAAFPCPVAALYLAPLQCFSFLCLITVPQFLAVSLVYRSCNHCTYQTIKFGVFPFPLRVSALQSSVQLPPFIPQRAARGGDTRDLVYWCSGLVRPYLRSF